MYFDAISYSPQALQQLIGFVGTERLFFGTDNPFFPPLHSKDIFKNEWPSTKKVYSTIASLNDKEAETKILRDNAVKLLGI
jgi:aminocarboxymuconate-semialdehyde decarboxylase